MKCVDPLSCPCWGHISTETHVPGCPFCMTPLRQSDLSPDRGTCTTKKHRSSQGEVTFDPETWTWLPREIFTAEDLPPTNGWRPIAFTEDNAMRPRRDDESPAGDFGSDSQAVSE